MKTTVVGSYPVPEWLRAYPSRDGLRDAMLAVLKTQELAGLDLLADGELGRFDVNHPETNGMIEYFIRPMSGIDTQFTRAELQAFRESEAGKYRQAPAGIVRGPIGEGTLNLPADFARVRPLTDRPLKFTVTGPHMLSKVLSDSHYGSPAELSLAIAEVLRKQVEQIPADVVQLDEANIPGHPQESAWAARAANRVLAGVQKTRAVHVCFGNYGGQTVQRGTWEALLAYLNALECDHLVLEFARRGYRELDVLKEVKPSIGLGIGVIDIKDNEVETPEEVARRIETAVKVLGAERIHYVHPDCGFWMLPRSVAEAKVVALVKGRDLARGASRQGR
jgi:5-methyltetrahydropteroyltriglutamate--homocysteine methyltransferase